MGMESILSQGPRSCPGLGERAGMWQSSVAPGDTAEATSLEDERRASGGDVAMPPLLGCWAHEGATRAAKGQRLR